MPVGSLFSTFLLFCAFAHPFALGKSVSGSFMVLSPRMLWEGFVCCFLPVCLGVISEGA